MNDGVYPKAAGDADFLSRATSSDEGDIRFGYPIADDGCGESDKDGDEDSGEGTKDAHDLSLPETVKVLVDKPSDSQRDGN